MDIISARLLNQHLIGDKFSQPKDVVSWFGAVQAQDFAAAKWGLGLRLKNSTDEQVEDAFNKGKILRTHVMRPTWHFVMPEDIRWMLEFTASRIKQFMGHYNRKLELTDALFKKTNAAIVKALKKEKYLTRQELKRVLEGMKIQTDVQRLGHIVSWAELDQLICSGPRRGKQFTYALLEERAPNAKILDKPKALAKLATNYFQSHGPVQLRDFIWWSGLSVKDATEGLNLIKSKLNEETIDDKTYWFSSGLKSIKLHSPTAFLVSIYDEYTIAYKDRRALDGERFIEKMISMGNWLTAVILIDGKLVGTWKRELKKDSVIVKLSLFEKPQASEKQALELAVQEYGEFLGLKPELVWK